MIREKGYGKINTEAINIDCLVRGLGRYRKDNGKKRKHKRKKQKINFDFLKCVQ